MEVDLQAIHCKLCDVVPINGAEWETETCEDFKLLVPQHSEVSVFVEADANGKSSVILYQQRDEVNMCVNALVIKNRLAKSTDER